MSFLRPGAHIEVAPIGGADATLEKRAAAIEQVQVDSTIMGVGASTHNAARELAFLNSHRSDKSVIIDGNSIVK